MHHQTIKSMWNRRISWSYTKIMGILLSMVSLDALAGTASDILLINVTVRSGCTVDDSDIDFGKYLVGQLDNNDAIGSVSYRNCTGRLSISAGGGKSENENARYMTAGADKLSYQLYRDASRTQVWGSGGNAQSVVADGLSEASIPIYGRVPSQQIVNPGIYSDSVLITLTF